MTKKIYLEPVWKLHSFYNSLIQHPPEGYEFLVTNSSQEALFKSVSRFNLFYSLQHGLDKVVPTSLAKSYLQRFQTIPEGTDLTFASFHLVFRKEPWIGDLEHVSALAGYSTKHLRRWRGTIERALASENCRKIICWFDVSRQTVLLNLDCNKFAQKIELVNPAIQKRDFIKNFNREKLKLLFVGSANIRGNFELKGGEEVFEVFKLLNARYGNLELVVRADVPHSLKDKYKNIANMKIIDKVIPWEMLDYEYKSADIFLFPVHIVPWSAFLEAMSYELPVVTIDGWGNSEIVADGKTGFIIPKSERVSYCVDNLIPACDTPQFKKAIRAPDPKVVQGLVEKVSMLIENAELRREMGKAGRWEVEHGQFSIEARNTKLKRIFDEATESCL